MKAKQILTDKALNSLFGKIRGGSFSVKYKNGETKLYGVDTPQFTIVVNDDDIFDLFSGDLLMSFGEAYTEGRVDVEGDLAELMALGIRNGMMSAIHGSNGINAASRAIGKLRSIKRERRNISHHYDLGNDFFRLWLDESMTYSCGYFHRNTDTLEQAQQQKIELSLRKLRLKPGEKLLDIGCGWGGLVMRAAEHYGAIANGITLSEEQCVGATEAIETHELEGKASVNLLDYATLAREGHQFDKIVSIGMIEHVGRENLEGFMSDMEKMLKPGGLALLHLITAVNEGPINGWIEKNIFPGGYIPSFAETIRHISACDLRIWDVENLAPHYRRTLDYWSERFENAVPAVRKKFDEKFVRMWRLYLRVSSAAFAEGEVEIHQILVSRGQPINLPLTRKDIYEEQRNVEHKDS